MSGRYDESNGIRPARGRRRRSFAMSALGVCAFALMALGAPPGFAAAAPGCPQGSGHDYIIGAGDVLQVSVWKQKRLSRALTVRPDGKISFPLIGDVQAAGLTPAQLATMVTRELKRYISNPRVSVIVKQANSFQVSVLGEVRQPGRYRIKSDRTTVLDVLAAAGGFTSFADKDSIGVLRDYGKTTARIHFRYYKAVSGNPGEADFCVRPGDTIIVP